MGTQEAEDISESPISSTIVQQTATMIFCPNPKADRKAYVEGMKLTQTEFDIIRTGMPEGSNRYLIKQGHSSVVVELDLSDPAFADSPSRYCRAQPPTSSWSTTSSRGLAPSPKPGCRSSTTCAKGS
jgi:hypothetical protein